MLTFRNADSHWFSSFTHCRGVGGRQLSGHLLQEALPPFLELPGTWPDEQSSSWTSAATAPDGHALSSVQPCQPYRVATILPCGSGQSLPGISQTPLTSAFLLAPRVLPLDVFPFMMPLLRVHLPEALPPTLERAVTPY